MKKEIKLSIDMMLLKIENINRNTSEIEKKIKKLQEELDKYDEALNSVNKQITDIGLRKFDEKTAQAAETPDKRSERITYNQKLQTEKLEYLKQVNPETAHSVSTITKETKDLFDLADF